MRSEHSELEHEKQEKEQKKSKGKRNPLDDYLDDLESYEEGLSQKTKTLIQGS